MTPQPARKSFWTILILIVSGEAIFLLPFVLPRIFRPTVLASFEMDNTQLGICFSIYGSVALASYLFGGPVADRFAPHKLMCIAMLATSAGGFVMASFPSLATLNLIYGFWGFTTIFLFWAAMLKATRQWGGENAQGKAYGFLDGGRGLVSALLGTVGVAIFSVAMGQEESAMSLAQQRAAYRPVILFTSVFVAMVGFVVLFALRIEGSAVPTERPKLKLANVMGVARLPAVWLLMLIVLCGYVGYKATDDLSLYANQVMQFSEVDSARLGTFLLYVRPIVGIAAGFLADWTRASTWLIAGFAMLMIGAIMIGSGVIEPGVLPIFYVSFIATCAGVYSIRALYFAAMQEGKIPLGVTGTAVGIISLVGYTPDIFMGPVMGYFLDRFPGERGHQLLFWFVAALGLIGLLASAAFRWRFSSGASAATK